MAASVLSLHAAYMACVIFGAFFTRGWQRFAALHVATLVYSVIVEIFGLWCPLTTFETWLEVRGGVSAYRGPFLLHCLDAVAYPNIPPNLLIAGAVAVCEGLRIWWCLFFRIFGLHQARNVKRHSPSLLLGLVSEAPVHRPGNLVGVESPLIQGRAGL